MKKKLWRFRGKRGQAIIFGYTPNWRTTKQNFEKVGFTEMEFFDEGQFFDDDIFNKGKEKINEKRKI